MKSILHTLVALVAVGKSNLSGWYVLLALLLLSVLFAGCTERQASGAAGTGSALESNL